MSNGATAATTGAKTRGVLGVRSTGGGSVRSAPGEALGEVSATASVSPAVLGERVSGARTMFIIKLSSKTNR